MKARDQKGQSTVEFALTLILLMAFTMFFLRLSLVFGFANYVHYATFMSARAYLAARPDADNQQQVAKDVIIGMLKKPGSGGVDRYPIIAKGEQGADIPGFAFNDPHYDPTDSSTVWMQGVRYRFRSRIFVMPLAGLSAKTSSQNDLILTSESWLGHEPADLDCRGDMQKAGEGIFDNGC